ncbi:lytic murein transglycosylase [Rhizobium sp. ZX09]|nr:lytic murein transglycosylase [Rhizobium sp. ZX09]
MTLPVVTPLCPAGHLPLKGGDRREGLPSLHSQMLRWPKPRLDSISPLEGEMPGRAEGGHSKRRSQRRRAT